MEGTYKELKLKMYGERMGFLVPIATELYLNQKSELWRGVNFLYVVL